MHQRPRAWSPRPQASRDATDQKVEREVEQVARTLQEEGVTDRRRLVELVEVRRESLNELLESWSPEEHKELARLLGCLARELLRDDPEPAHR